MRALHSPSAPLGARAVAEVLEPLGSRERVRSLVEDEATFDSPTPGTLLRQATSAGTLMRHGVSF